MSKNGNGFKQLEFNDYIVKRNIVGFYREGEEKRLSSGRLSPYYVDWKFVMGDSDSLRDLSKYVISFVRSRGLNPAGFIGVREGASPIGIAATLEWSQMQKEYGDYSRHPVIMGRGRPKDGHGDSKYRNFVGGDPKGQFVVLEDVATTGDSTMDEVDAITKVGGDVMAVVALTDRCEKRDDGRSVDDLMKDRGIKYYPMSKSTDLIRETFQQRQDGPEYETPLEKYFETYGTEKLNLHKIPHMSRKA
jgi:orotate phosphoribosyltransferase